MIVVTGAAGFIGSALVGRLLQEGYGEIVAVDDFSKTEKEGNLVGKTLFHKIHRDDFPAWLNTNGKWVQFVFHIGARTDTAEFDMELLNYLNLDYSKQIWNLCTENSIPLIYASSAATFGSGERGFDDNVADLELLQPLNPYGWSKHHFDLWVQQQKLAPPFWAGFKFFNVFGPNEYHKGRMASVVYHAYNQIHKTGKMKLFRSHKPEFENGKQLRDFIYVKDVLKVMMHFMEHRKHSDLYNLGAGKARTFYDLVESVFNTLQLPLDIEFIDIPVDIRDTYQYYTCASMSKIKQAGFLQEFGSLEAGIDDYINQYLRKGSYY